MLSSSLEITCSNIALCSINIPFHMKDSLVELQNRTDAQYHFIQWRIQSKYTELFLLFLYNIFTLYERTKLQTWIIPLLDFLRFVCLLDPILFVIGDSSEIIHRLYLSSQLTVWSYISSRYRRRRASSYFPIREISLSKIGLYYLLLYSEISSSILCGDNLIFFSH